MKKKILCLVMTLVMTAGAATTALQEIIRELTDGR